MKDWPDGPPVTQQEWLQSQASLDILQKESDKAVSKLIDSRNSAEARIEDALAHYRDGGQSDNLVAIEMVRLLVGKK
jgi:hypothetical protein